jgi:hypothetical protein
MPTQTDIDRLVAAVIADIDFFDKNDEAISQHVRDAIEPFRPKKPRTTGVYIAPEGEFTCIELTDEVKARLSETARVDRKKICKIVDSEPYTVGVADAIMALIAKHKVDHE